MTLVVFCVTFPSNLVCSSWNVSIVEFGDIAPGYVKWPWIYAVAAVAIPISHSHCQCIRWSSFIGLLLNLGRDANHAAKIPGYTGLLLKTLGWSWECVGQISALPEPHYLSPHPIVVAITTAHLYCFMTNLCRDINEHSRYTHYQAENSESFQSRPEVFPSPTIPPYFWKFWKPHSSPTNTDT